MMSVYESLLYQNISSLTPFYGTLQKGTSCVKVICGRCKVSGKDYMGNIRIKAGKEAYEIIKDGGFNLDMVASYFAPAGGPRWLIASGFDLTLLKSGLLGKKKPVLLAGASAGAMRFAAWLQPEAEDCYLRLMDAYISMPFGRNDRPATVYDALNDVINAYLEDDALSFALSSKKYRLAIITARAKNLLASEVHWVQWLGFGLCFLMNCLDRSHLYNFAERVVFYTGAKPPDFCFRKGFRGRYVTLTEVNFKHAVLASAAIPLVISGVRNIYGAPDGVYRDGGLIDYHLTHRFGAQKSDVALFFHHQERIIPGWLDKRLSSRKPDGGSLDNVIMVYPAQEFTAKLPGGRIPDRTDFATFINDPRQRMENWRRAAETAAPLGEEFLELLFSGKIREATEKLD
jgi:hypothetical protein